MPVRRRLAICLLTVLSVVPAFGQSGGQAGGKILEAGEGTQGRRESSYQIVTGSTKANVEYAAKYAGAYSSPFRRPNYQRAPPIPVKSCTCP